MFCKPKKMCFVLNCEIGIYSLFHNSRSLCDNLLSTFKSKTNPTQTLIPNLHTCVSSLTLMPSHPLSLSSTLSIYSGKYTFSHIPLHVEEKGESSTLEQVLSPNCNRKAAVSVILNFVFSVLFWIFSCILMHSICDDLEYQPKT